MDFLRFAVVSGPGKSNRAYTLSSLRKENPFALSLMEVSKASLSVRGRSYVWACRLNSRVVGLAAARQRSGPQIWEITHLFLTPEGKGDFPDLLESVAQVAASHGAQKVFLRLRQDDPLVDLGRLSGFFPCIPEILYKGLPPQKGESFSAPSDEPPLPLRRKTRSDEHDLFRLYNAAVPSEIRQVVGMTLELWKASQEFCDSSREEVVMTNESMLRGWLATVRRSSIGQISAMMHPDDERHLASLLDFGLEQLTGATTVFCLVPEYQIALQRVLEDRGFEAVSDYITLVKSMALTVREKARSRARIAPTYE